MPGAQRNGGSRVHLAHSDLVASSAQGQSRVVSQVVDGDRVFTEAKGNGGSCHRVQGKAVVAVARVDDGLLHRAADADLVRAFAGGKHGVVAQAAADGDDVVARPGIKAAPAHNTVNSDLVRARAGGDGSIADRADHGKAVASFAQIDDGFLTCRALHCAP